MTDAKRDREPLTVDSPLVKLLGQLFAAALDTSEGAAERLDAARTAAANHLFGEPRS